MADPNKRYKYTIEFIYKYRENTSVLIYLNEDNLQTTKLKYDVYNHDQIMMDKR